MMQKEVGLVLARARKVIRIGLFQERVNFPQTKCCVQIQDIAVLLDEKLEFWFEIEEAQVSRARGR